MAKPNTKKPAPKPMGGKNPSRPASSSPDKLRPPVESGPPKISDEILEKIASEEAGGPPPFRGAPDFESIRPDIRVPPEGFGGPGYEPPFAAPAKGIGETALELLLSRGAPVAAGAAGMLIPSQIGAGPGSGGAGGFNDRLEQQRGVLPSPNLSPQEYDSMLAEAMAAPSAAPKAEFYPSLEPSSGGGIIPASQSAKSPKSRIAPTAAPAGAAPVEELNPYMTEKTPLNPSYMFSSPADEEMINRIMQDEFRKNVR